MTIPFDSDARALFNANDFGVPCTATINGVDYATLCHWDAPGKDVNIPGPGVSSLEERIEFAASTLPGLTSGNFVTVDLSAYGQSTTTRFKVRNTTPQNDGMTVVATLQRVTKP